MIERKKIPFESKWNFLITNWEMSKAVFHRPATSDQHKSKEALELIQKARMELGFSLRTSHIDVFMSLKKVWAHIAKEAVTSHA